jgi:hypothetical protein
MGRSIAQIISFVFHPLLVPTYMLIIFMLVNPYAFSVSSISDQFSKLLLIQLFMFTFFIPAFSVVMLRLLDLVESVELKTKEERIGPYIIAGIFYLWTFRNFLGDAQMPRLFVSFLLGATIALFLAFLINIFSKISAHTVGMGGLVGTVILTMYQYQGYNTFMVHSTILGTFEISIMAVLLFVILLAGIVGTCRLLLGAHGQQDLYGGYMVGLVSQFVAFRIMIL